MRLTKTTSTKIHPDEVIWPRYCLGHIPCPFTVTHGAHFWMHFSGYPAVCEGVLR